MNIYEKLQKSRKEILTSNMKKSAVNKFAKFNYFTLEDIIPQIDLVQEKYNFLICTSFEETKAITKVINCEKPEEFIKFESFCDLKMELQQIKGIQAIGANHTYFRRYMLMLVFELVEADTLDAIVGKPDNIKITRNDTQEEIKLRTATFTNLHKTNKFTKEEMEQITQSKNSKEMNLNDWDDTIKRAYDVLSSRDV